MLLLLHLAVALPCSPLWQLLRTLPCDRYRSNCSIQGGSRRRFALLAWTLPSAGRQRPVESTRSVHVLARLHLFVPSDTKICVIPWHLCVLSALESRKSHHLRHLPCLVIHAFWPYSLLLHDHILGPLLVKGIGLDGFGWWSRDIGGTALCSAWARACGRAAVAAPTVT